MVKVLLNDKENIEIDFYLNFVGYKLTTIVHLRINRLVLNINIT